MRSHCLPGPAPPCTPERRTQVVPHPLRETREVRRPSLPGHRGSGAAWPWVWFTPALEAGASGPTPPDPPHLQAHRRVSASPGLWKGVLMCQAGQGQDGYSRQKDSAAGTTF